MLAMRKCRMRWLVYLFSAQIQFQKPLQPPSTLPGPRALQVLGEQRPRREVAWGRVWAAGMEMKLNYAGDICSSKLAKGTTASHSFIRGLTATGCPWRALTGIQLVANPIYTPLHKLTDHCPAESIAHLLHHIPGSVPSLPITSTTGLLSRLAI